MQSLSNELMDLLEECQSSESVGLIGSEGNVKKVIAQIDRKTLVDAVLTDFEKYFTALLEIKFIPDELLNAVPLDEIGHVLDLLAQYEYTPSPSFVNGLMDISADYYAKALNMFPSIPVRIQSIMKLINNGEVDTAIDLVVARKELQKPKTIILLCNEKETDELIEIAKNSDETLSIQMNEILKDFNNVIKKKKNSRLITECLLKDQDKILSEKGFSWYTENTDLFGSYSNIFESCFMSEGMIRLIKSIEEMKDLINSRQSHYNQKYSKNTISIHWSEELDRDEEILHSSRYRIKGNVPKGSNLRYTYLEENISSADDEELADIINSSSSNRIRNRAVYQILRCKDIDFMSSIEEELAREIERLSPADTRKAVSNRKSDVVVYLMKITDSKHRSELKKIVPIEDLPFEYQKRKKSYFLEANMAIESKDIESFRKYLSEKYTLDKFISDSWQSSKESLVDKTTIHKEFSDHLNKEEFLKLCNGRHRFGSRWDTSKNFPFTVESNEEEISLLLKKFCASTIFNNSEDKLHLFENANKYGLNLGGIWGDFNEYLLSHDEFFKSLIEYSKEKKINYNSNDEELFLSKLNKEDFRNIFGVVNPLHFMVKKAMDGEFVVSEEEIISKIKSRPEYIEREHVLSDLFARLPIFAKEICEAYLGGNKDMTKLMGRSIKITRSQGKKNLVSSYLGVSDKSDEDIVNDFYANGGCSSKIKGTPRLRSILPLYHDNRPVKVSNFTSSRYNNNTETIKDLALEGVSFDISTFTIQTLPDFSIENMRINKVVLDTYSDDIEFHVEIANFCSNLLKENSDVELDVSESSFQSSSQLHRVGIIDDGALFSAFDKAIESDSNLELETVSYTYNNGYPFSDDILISLINSQSDDELLSWLIKKIGNLEGSIFCNKYFYQTKTDLIVGSGGKIVEKDEYELITKMNQLRSEGIKEGVSLKNYPREVKVEIIDILEEVDERFKTLNLKSSNITLLDHIYPFEKMEEVYSQDIGQIAKIFNLEPNVIKNKKLVLAISEFFSESGTNLGIKILLLKESMEQISPKTEIKTSDLIDYSDLAEIKESELLKVMDPECLMVVVKNLASLKEKNITILKDKKKQSIMRFVKTSSKVGVSITRDTFQMIESSVRGYEMLTDRMVDLKEENELDSIDELQRAVDSVKESLIEVTSIDDITLMHDRLVPLSNFIKRDPLQPLGQAKYKKLEKDKKLKEEIGHSILFPKTRGDLIQLGDIHGWCVNTHSGYADGVINKGNILFVICEGEPTINSAIALGHFVKRTNRTYRLEQLRWSKSKRNGRTNQDATNSFKHSVILEALSNLPEAE